MHKTIFATLLLVSLAPLVALGQAPGTAELAPSFLLRDFEKEEADFNQSLPEGAVVVSEQTRERARLERIRRRPTKSEYAFHLQKNDRVVFLGDALLEREQWYGHLETRLTVRYPRKQIRFRNLSWSGDTPTGRSRASFDWHKDESAWFERIQQPLETFSPTVIVLGYGMANSFDGLEGLDKFRADLNLLIDRIGESLSENPPRFVLLGPIKHENLGGDLPDPDDHNRVLYEYSTVISEVATERGAPFVNLYDWLGDGGEARINRVHTENGIHLNEYGYSRLSDTYSTALGAEPIIWEVGLGREGLKSSRVAGSRVTDVKNLPTKTIFSVRDSILPFPNRDDAGKAYPTAIGIRRIGFMNLPAGRHLLKIDGQPIVTHYHNEWSSGMYLTRGPMFDQAEALRKLIVEKNELFFHRFRPENHTYLFGFRKHEQGNNAVEIAAFDPLIAELEEEIFRLSIPRRHFFELVALNQDEPDPAESFQLAKFEPKKKEELQFDPPVIDQPLPEFKLADGLEISLYAHNPLLHKPIQMNFDPQGRLWVASSSVYPQIQPGQSADDTIIVLEDRDKDGVAESSTVFAEGLLIPTGVEPGDGGVYVGQSTELLHFKDTNGDGKADQRRVVLSGFGTEDTHHILHTLRWGHDGQLYMNQSIYIHSHIETPHGVERLNSGGVWHLRPNTLELGVFVKGFCNPWGHHFDDYGQSFITDGAGFQGITYGVPGAMYFTYARAPRLLDSVSPGSYPKYCGLEILYSEQFPEEWQGSAITCDFRSHRIVQFSIDEQGAGYAAQEQPELVRGLSNTFRPIDVKLGPDGALYVADWSNPIIQHGEVDFRDPRRDKSHGRIWRISYKDKALVKTPNLVDATDEALLDSLLSKNGYERHQARRVLTERGQTIRKTLNRWTEKQEDEAALLQSLWMYQSIDELKPELLDQLLAAKDGRVRAAAVRVLRFWQDRIGGSQNLLAKSVNDEHPRVRLEAVRALIHDPSAKAAAAVLEGLNHPVDRFMDYALWLSINDLSEPWVNAIQSGLWSPKGHEKQLEFGLQSISPNEASKVLERLLETQTIDRKGSGSWIELIGKAGTADDLGSLLKRVSEGGFDTPASLRVVEALGEANRLRRVNPGKEAAAIAALFDHTDSTLQSSALRLAGAWKMHGFEGQFQTKAADPQAPRSARDAAIDALGSLGSNSAYQKLSILLSQPGAASIRPQVMQALAAMNLADSIGPILSVISELGQEADLRATWETILRQKKAEGVVLKALRDVTLSEDAARMGMRIARETGKNLSELLLGLERAGNLAPSEGAAGRELISQLASQTMEGGDPDRGEAVYRRLELGCVMCHAIGGVGGLVGPDLTSIGASAPVDYLVESLLAPNDKVKEGYHSLIVETNDGEEYSGILVGEDGSELVLRNAANQTVSIAKQNVANRIVGGSLMPAGLIEGLEASEKLDLFRFLSELGKPGRFDAARGNVARKWRLRAGRHTDEQFGIERIIANPSGNQWRPAMTLVDGRLEQDTMREALNLRNINQVTSLIGLFTSTQFQVPRKGSVTLRFAAPKDTLIWVDGKTIPFSKESQLELDAGVHEVVLKLNPRTLPDSIRMECDEGTFLVK
ncbi:GDSL-type esterase/lipase family protein [Verrucomicrobia bacterium]|nr:GDSL-type esterase/lipase family protein [Verrucomicrobiota bacterium]